jgi:nitrate/nitrite transporter NarK
LCRTPAAGLRTFSQQGMFIIGGTLADRYGAKAIILAGCVVRVPAGKQHLVAQEEGKERDDRIKANIKNELASQ